jgi:hypothetical protein
MKRRKRTSDDGSLPVVTMAEGRYSVEVTPGSGCFVRWWMEMEDGEEHWFVQLHTPVGVAVHQVDNDAIFTRPARH